MKFSALKSATSLFVTLSLLSCTHANASLVNSTKANEKLNEQMSYYLAGMTNNSILAAENSVLTIPIEVNHQFSNSYVVYSDNETVSGGIEHNVLTLQIDEVNQDTAVNVSLVNENDELQVALNITVNILDQPTLALPNYAIALNDEAGLPSALTGSNVLSVRTMAPISAEGVSEFSPFSQVNSNSAHGVFSNENSEKRAKSINISTSDVPKLTAKLFTIDKYLSSDNSLTPSNADDRKETIISAFKNVAAQYKNNQTAMSNSNMPTNLGDSEQTDDNGSDANGGQTNDGSSNNNNAENGTGFDNGAINEGSEQANNSSAPTNDETSHEDDLNSGHAQGDNPSGTTQGGDSHSQTAQNVDSNNNAATGDTPDNTPSDDGLTANTGTPSPSGNNLPINDISQINDQTLPTSGQANNAYQIPEPATSAIFALALAGLATRQRKRKKA